ncbi:MAG: ornithine carbamoyltransferase [Nitrospirae bacterium]|nr:ornithine carbamoyltransferase [Nitrospirota bacterium]
MARHLLSLDDLPAADLDHLFARATHFKKNRRKHERPLEGKSVALIFQKASTRTRVSFEVGIHELGGTPIFLSGQDTHLVRGEEPRDVGRIMSRYVDGIVLRTFAQSTLEEIARNASVPVVNALTDALHPCQILADLFTLVERGRIIAETKLVYIGDGNNIANTLAQAAALYGMKLTVACPKGFEPDKAVLQCAKQNGRAVRIERDPVRAAEGADVLYTDVWVSMGQEKDRGKKLKAFRKYQINEKIVRAAGPNALVMHCLPAHRGEEITEEVIESDRSIVFDQAENRLHVQKAILERLFGGLR